MLGINLLSIDPLCLRKYLLDKDLWLSSEQHHSTIQWDKFPGVAFRIRSRKFLLGNPCSLLELRLVDTFQVHIAPELLSQPHKSCQQGTFVRLIGQNQQDSSSQQGMGLVAL
jgi:hypothetical protein